ncbi:hypothetical protein L8S13_03840 [Vibrio lentus]|uniref:hypothetical protein n=1 Tax=Vibrio lentus TaxID=136468 RepID=UPI0024684319|nr:hypothetical protein [Vibrio lentus]MDH5925410.1 hypothetical protein [Vibrio lentus]
MISALLNLVTGGVATYKQLNQNKADALKRKDELENEKHQARIRRHVSAEIRDTKTKYSQQYQTQRA